MPSILVVEDSATQAMALRSVLEAQHFTVSRTATGEAALEYLQTHEVDLVLSDIVMPGISGYELTRQIKGDDRLSHLPVVLLTSLTDPLDIVRGLECGADNYVTKPYDPQYLCARIRHVLDRQRLRVNPRASLGVNVSFLGTTFSITSDKEQILDLFISTVEDVVRTNRALQESQRELAAAQARLEEYARGMSQQAKLSTEKYAALMHQASDAIAVLDDGGRILEVNLRATELFGLPAEQLTGRGLHELVTRESAWRVRAELQRLAFEPRVSAELDVVHSSGRIAMCSWSASRTQRAEGDLVLAILHDITEINEASKRVQKREAQLAQAQQLAGLGSWERDLGSDQFEWSRETSRIFGAPEGTKPRTSADFLAFVHPEDRAMVERFAVQAMESDAPVNSAFRVVRPDGSLRSVVARAESIRDERGQAVRLLGTIQDVTEQQQLEEQLHQSQKMEAVGQLAGGVAHDFNNLLTVITSYCELLLAETSEQDHRRADIAEIASAASRAAGLTRQLLAFSRRQVLEAKLVDLSQLTRQLEKLLRRLVREDISIVTDLEDRTCVVWADQGQLEQVLMNLVVNARDAMPNGGTLTIRTRCLGDQVALEVADTGTGMTAEVQARIFEPFFTTKEPGAGTGLGLATVYGIVQQSEGTISVDSTVGAGTTFRIMLPSRGDAVAAPAEAEPKETRKESAGETILVVEDDPALRAVACRVLRGQGYRVLEAANGKEAIEVCDRADERIDLVLTDMVMPEMSGYELGKHIAACHPEVHLLFMSGYTRDAMERDGLAKDGAAYLEKPFTPASLASKVREVLDAPAGPRRTSGPIVLRGEPA